MPTTIEETLYDHLVEDPDTSKLDESLEAVQPRNFLIHAGSLALTKTGDALVDPKLVLAWLIGALGAPAWMVGLLVPVRESLALLPQLFTAGPVSQMRQRKWAWIFGSVGQALAVAGMAATAWFLEGATAGWSIVGLLALFALSRSICSVSYKDVLGKTVAKKTRGTATGTAGTVAATTGLLFGVALATGWLAKNAEIIALVLATAALLWAAAALLFSLLREPARRGSKSGGLSLSDTPKHFADPQFRLFVISRALLTATALAPPFIIAAADFSVETVIGTLGLFVTSSALAGILSSYIWGRLSDRSSRQVLIWSGVVSAIALAAAATAILADSPWLAALWFLPLIHFLLMIAYQGVRRGRSTHLVDMAGEDRRAAYTALSNTTIGLVLVAGGAFSALAAIAGSGIVLIVMAVFCALSVPVSMRLDEVQ